ncbi:hypothetical protein BJ508DRAFT_333072 [Ascobolus immersus RN42]|uniref:Uncharacterized protein n=1 Tax=Ascobolus immersus RN42 TaxID=1160509 RepID=A0A3N4HNB3_ASCIM|nr:hypothetical protein BJ508DRAFT_333072 [Ascobolus immersus RN42]
MAQVYSHAGRLMPLEDEFGMPIDKRKVLASEQHGRNTKLSKLLLDYTTFDDCKTAVKLLVAALEHQNMLEHFPAFSAENFPFLTEAPTGAMLNQMDTYGPFVDEHIPLIDTCEADTDTESARYEESRRNRGSGSRGKKRKTQEQEATVEKEEDQEYYGSFYSY